MAGHLPPSGHYPSAHEAATPIVMHHPRPTLGGGSTQTERRSHPKRIASVPSPQRRSSVVLADAVGLPMYFASAVARTVRVPRTRGGAGVYSACPAISNGAAGQGPSESKIVYPRRLRMRCRAIGKYSVTNSISRRRTPRTGNTDADECSSRWPSDAEQPSNRVRKPTPPCIPSCSCQCFKDHGSHTEQAMAASCPGHILASRDRRPRTVSRGSEHTRANCDFLQVHGVLMHDAGKHLGPVEMGARFSGFSFLRPEGDRGQAVLFQGCSVPPIVLAPLRRRCYSQVLWRRLVREPHGPPAAPRRQSA